MFKKFLAALLISFSVLSTAAFAENVPYDDVPSAAPYFYAVEYLRRNDVVKDTTRFFKPDQLISKAEFIKYLVLINSDNFKPAKNIKLPYKDTRNNAAYAPYIYEAIQLGILDERKLKLRPYEKLSIFEALELLFHSKSIPIPKTYNGIVRYTDVEKNKRVQPLVMRALEFDIVRPERDDYFGIYRKINRATAAEMIYRMDLVNLEPPTLNTQNIDRFDPGLQKFITAWQLIQSTYLKRDELDSAKLSDAALKALVLEIDDPYAAYLTPKESESFVINLQGELEGIGAFISEEKGEITIVSPIKNTPAERVGLKPGDIIHKIDGTSTEGMSLNEAVSRIKGPRGTTVILTIRRNDRVIDFSIVREHIVVKAVEWETVGNGSIMHIKITQFNQNADAEFLNAITAVQADPNIKGVILDVRTNPGGLLGVTVNMLKRVLPPKAVVVSVQYNFFTYKEFTGTNGGELSEYPMVVLINKGSASASEILAGAIKDHEVGTVVGETSFGKGTVQEVNTFSDTSTLKLTVANWLTPSGHSIQDNGIEPDVKVVATNGSRDNQLDKAIQILRTKF